MNRFNTYEKKLELVKFANLKENFGKILSDLKNALIENQSIIIEANKQDVNYNKKQIKIEELIKIIDSYKEKRIIDNRETSKKLVILEGNTYLLMHVILQAIITSTKLTIVQENFMYGVNEVIIAIVKKVLKTYELENAVEIYNEFSFEKFERVYLDFVETVVIGKSNEYYKLLKKNYENLKLTYYPYNNIGLYCSTEKLEELQKAIYIFASENEYEIEILYSEDIDEAIEELNADSEKNIAILLTNDEEEKNKFMGEILNKDVFINENPFKDEVGRIYTYLR